MPTGPPRAALARSTEPAVPLPGKASEAFASRDLDRDGAMSAGEGDQLVSDHGGRRGAVEGDRACLEHLRLGYGPAFPDLVPPASLRPGGCCASYAASRASCVGPSIRSRNTRSNRSRSSSWFRAMPHTNTAWSPGQDRLHPEAAPYPAMRPEPLPVRECRAVHLMTSRVFPVRQTPVVVGVNSQHAATGQLPGKFRLPRSRIASDKECGHKPSSQPGQTGLSGGQASGTTVFPSHSVIRPCRLGKRYPPFCGLWALATLGR